jgi:hypothetical protein
VFESLLHFIIILELEIVGKTTESLWTETNKDGLLLLPDHFEELIDRVLLDKDGLRRCHAARARQAILEGDLGRLIPRRLDQVWAIVIIYLQLLLKVVLKLDLGGRVRHDHLDAVLGRRQEVVEVRKNSIEHV